jgi:hypothetical protein
MSPCATGWGGGVKGIQYALLPKTIKYKRSRDIVNMTTNGVTLQVAKTAGLAAADFRVYMAECWQRLTAKTGGAHFFEKPSFQLKKKAI